MATLGDRPRQVITTTPRPIAVLKEILASPTTRVSRGSTYDNRGNLAPSFIAQIIARYEGTRLGRQELQAEILDDIPGALWTRDNIDKHRKAQPPDLIRVVVAVDPSGTRGQSDDGDSIGIVVAGKGVDGRGYVLADRTCKMSPDGWGRRAVQAYKDFKADRIVAERNFGGAMVEHVIRTVDQKVPYREVTASRGKVARAEPVAALYEQGKVSHVGSLPELEDQLCQFGPDGYMGDGSPDRADACLVAGTSVTTERGQVPIELVLAGDRVLTRSGWHPVSWAGLTRARAQTFNVALSDGNVVTATEEHPVFIKNIGFVPVRNIREGDVVLSEWEIACCKKVRLSRLAFVGRPIGATLTALRNLISVITPRFQAPGFKLCIGMYGKRPVVQFPQDGTSTIKTAISSTTTSIISNAFLRLITLLGTKASIPNKTGGPWRVAASASADTVVSLNMID